MKTSSQPHAPVPGRHRPGREHVPAGYGGVRGQHGPPLSRAQPGCREDWLPGLRALIPWRGSTYLLGTGAGVGSTAGPPLSRAQPKPPVTHTGCTGHRSPGAQRPVGDSGPLSPPSCRGSAPPHPPESAPTSPTGCHASTVDNEVMGVTPSAWRACFLQSPVRVPGSGREQADVPGSRDKQAGGRSWGNGALTRHTLLRQRRGSPPLPREGPVPARLPRAVEGLPARSADTWHAVLNHLLNLPGDRGLCPSQPAPASSSAGRHLHHHSCCSAVCGVHGEMDGQTHTTGWWHRLETSWPSAHRPHLHKTRLDSAVGNAPGAKRFTSQLATRGHRLPVLLAEAGPTACLCSWGRQVHRGGPTGAHTLTFQAARVPSGSWW